MAKWVQFDMTGNPVETAKVSEACREHQRETQTARLALEVQLSIAKLSPLSETLKLVGELCESITGIGYPINLEERTQAKQAKAQRDTEQAIATAPKEPIRAKRKPGRPRKNPLHNFKERDANR